MCELGSKHMNPTENTLNRKYKRYDEAFNRRAVDTGCYPANTEGVPEMDDINYCTYFYGIDPTAQRLGACPSSIFSVPPFTKSVCGNQN